MHRNVKINPHHLLYKTSAIIFSSLLPGLAASAQETCDLNVRNSSGSSIGRIESNGDIRNSSGSLIGSFRSGSVRNSSGSSIGRIDPDGSIRNGSGSKIGNIDMDGTLRNSNGSIIGRVTLDGTVRNSSGSSRGRFENYVPACRHAAAAYLFFFEPLYNH
jgi:hypothetical protein